MLPSEILSFSKPRSKSIHTPIKKLKDKTDSYKIRHKTIVAQANWIIVGRFRFEFLIARKCICFIVAAKMCISNKVLTLLVCALFRHENLDIFRSRGHSLHKHNNSNDLVRHFNYRYHFFRFFRPKNYLVIYLDTHVFYDHFSYKTDVAIHFKTGSLSSLLNVACLVTMPCSRVLAGK